MLLAPGQLVPEQPAAAGILAAEPLVVAQIVPVSAVVRMLVAA